MEQVSRASRSLYRWSCLSTRYRRKCLGCISPLRKVCRGLCIPVHTGVALPLAEDLLRLWREHMVALRPCIHGAIELTLKLAETRACGMDHAFDRSMLGGIAL